jgi:hypothetical protein
MFEPYSYEYGIKVAAIKDMNIMNWLTSLFGQKPDEGDSNKIQSSLFPREKENISPGYSQKRRYPRFLVEGMDIRSKMIFAEPVHLSNISVGGACIITKMPLNTDNNVLIRINRDRIRRPLLGTIIWESQSGGIPYRENKSLPLYRAGIQFKGITPETLVQLKDFMRISGVPEEKPYVETYKPNALRYVITREEGAILNYPATYTVKKISLSGMLIEANCKLEVEQKYPMALFLPSEGTVKFNGRIASQIPIPGRESSFDTGIEFCNLIEHEKTRLKRFITSLL